MCFLGTWSGMKCVLGFLLCHWENIYGRKVDEHNGQMHTIKFADALSNKAHDVFYLRIMGNLIKSNTSRICLNTMTTIDGTHKRKPGEIKYRFRG